MQQINEQLLGDLSESQLVQLKKAIDATITKLHEKKLHSILEKAFLENDWLKAILIHDIYEDSSLPEIECVSFIQSTGRGKPKAMTANTSILEQKLAEELFNSNIDFDLVNYSDTFNRREFI